MLYDYIFMKIINNDIAEECDAIDYAIDKSNLDEIKRAQLHILNGMQKQIILLKENCELERQNAELYKEYVASSKDILDMVSKEVIKVTVTPIKDEGEGK